MFKARNLTVVLVGLIVLGVIWRAVQAWVPPSPRRFAADSYSGRIAGYRALYELLDAFDVPVARWTGAPSTLFAGWRRVVLLEPELPRVELERGYLAQLETWLRGGGELVIVSDHVTWREERVGPGAYHAFEELLGDDELLPRLGISDLEIMGHEGPVVEPEAPEEAWEYLFEDVARRFRRPEKVYSVYASGSLENLGEAVHRVRLPGQGLRCFVGKGTEKAIGKIEVGSGDNEHVPVILEFARGAGRVILVSEPTFLTNIGLSHEDNAVLAFRLAAGTQNREVVLDEYYHGAMAQANPFALLGVHPYWFIAVNILVATLLWVWSTAIRFGPPARIATESRRNILEYIDAMARLFRRGGKQRFVLATCRDGLVEEIREELYVRPGASEELVLRRLAQSDAGRAERLQTVLEEIDRVLAGRSPLGTPELVELEERLETCRISTDRSPLHEHLLMSLRSTTRL